MLFRRDLYMMAASERILTFLSRHRRLECVLGMQSYVGVPLVCVPLRFTSITSTARP